MNKPRDEHGRFLRTNPNAWVRPKSLPQYHPAHSSTQANVLLRKIIDLRGNAPLVAEPVAVDAEEINTALGSESPNLSDLLRQIVTRTQPTEEGTK